MAKLVINISNTYHHVPYLKVNGVKQRLKKQANGHCCTIDVDSQADIELYDIHELDCKGWFWYALLVWVISVFGIFGGGFDKKYYSYRYRAMVNVSHDITLNYSLNFPKEGAKVLVCQGQEWLDNESNIYRYRKDLCRRARIYNFIRFLSVVAIVVAVLYYFDLM